MMQKAKNNIDQKGSSNTTSSSDTRVVKLSNGKTYEIPKDWTSRPANNGKGTVYQKPGATGNADMIRIMDPTPMYPKGYIRYYNQHGQPLDVTGHPTSNDNTHIPLDYDGEIIGWPESGSDGQ